MFIAYKYYLDFKRLQAYFYCQKISRKKFIKKTGLSETVYYRILNNKSLNSDTLAIVMGCYGLHPLETMEIKKIKIKGD